MFRRSLIVLACFALASMAWAHGNEEHVMGTVMKISGSTITVKTTAKKTMEVTVTDKTKFAKSGQPATLHDLAVGDRVVIHASKSENKLSAVMVQFASTSTTAGNAQIKK